MIEKVWSGMTCGEHNPAPDIVLDAATNLSVEAGHGRPCGILLSLSRRRGGVWHYLV